MFSVTKNRNTRIPRYGQVCRGTYHAKEIPRYTGVPVFFPNPNHHIRFTARFPLPRVGLFDKSSSKTSSPLRAILRVSRVHI